MLTRRVLQTRYLGRSSTRIFKVSPTRFSRRCFSEKPKVEGNAGVPPPPPPPPSSGGGGGMWILLTAALAGGGYYFKDEISDFLGWGKKEVEEKAHELGDAVVHNVEETKKAVLDAEKRLEESAKSAASQVKTSLQSAGEKVQEKAEEIKGKTEVAVVLQSTATADSSAKADWKAIREEIEEILEVENYDDGSYGPVLVRLAWHSAGTYDKNTKKGGTEGAAMRFAPESKWGANAGLDVARKVLEPIKAKHPEITYSDLWSFAGTVAIEEMGGPEIKWRPGRKDYQEGENILPDGLLPDADGRETPKTPQDHVRNIFGRMGFNDQEMVALIGAHDLGRVHVNRSGYWGPWTRAPTTFSNEFFRLLVEEKWTPKKTHEGAVWKGPLQYEDPTGELMMLPTDLCLVQDEKFKKYVEIYAKDEDKFFKDFSKAWIKLQENGVRRFHAWPKYIFFGPRE